MRAILGLLTLAVFVTAAASVSAQRLPGTSPGPKAPWEGEDATALTPITEDELGPGVNNPQPGYHDNGRGGNSFVNDPCIDPPPTAPPPENRRRTVQSETELAVFDRKYIVAGYNDSFGFYNNRQGLAGYAYSIDGGNSWVDGGGLPPRVPTGASPFTPGVDGFFGDPVIVADQDARVFTKNSSGDSLATPIKQAAGQFYYSAIYKNPSGVFTLSVSRGRFMIAPPTTPETESNTRCVNDPTQFGVPDPPENKERIVWELPVEAVVSPFLGPTNGDFLDKEWLHVDRRTGTLYLTYTRFATDGSTPIELVRSFDGGRTWTPPSVIVPNEAADFNQGTYPVTVALPNGGTRVVVFWWARSFVPPFTITGRRIEYAVSNDDGNTFGPEQLVSTVFRQSEAPGYNRGRTDMFNPPFADVRGNDVYVTYMSGKAPGNPPATGASSGPRPSDVFVSSSHDGGLTFGSPVKVNDDVGRNTHVFPNIRVSKQGFVYVAWLDRRNDLENELTDAWAAVSHDDGATFGHNKLQTDVATGWRVRADARPNFGDYNSSDLLGDNQFVMVWADGRFPPPAPTPQAATPDTIFTIAQGLGVGNDPNPNNP